MAKKNRFLEAADILKWYKENFLGEEISRQTLIVKLEESIIVAIEALNDKATQNKIDS